MKQLIYILFSLALLISISACKKLPVYESAYIENESEIFNKDNDAPPFVHYDTESRIRYDVFHDGENLLLYFDVSDEMSIRKIFGLGLEIYIDTNGKRKKDNGYIYPVAGAAQQSAVLEPQGLQPALPDKSNLSKLQKNISSEYILIDDGEEETFNLFATHNDLDISMRLTESGNLEYKASIPLALFGIDSLPEEITIGILSGELPEDEDEMNEYDPNNQNNDMQNSTHNNPMSPQSPVSGNMPGSNRMQNNNRPYDKRAEPIRIWFRIKPVEKKPDEL